MITQENSTGKPLADASWLENHHRAKIPERTAFSQRLKDIHPKRIVDLGCATGLWLELLDTILPTDCEFIGIDSDAESLKEAESRSKSWNRKVSFMQLDIERDAFKIPSGDITLAFNIFPYINNIDSFLKTLAERTPKGYLAIRQYDGASIRFGPMSTSQRQKMESDLRVATEKSQKFKHYDLDRTFSALRRSSYNNGNYEFELFARTSPFKEDFIPYYKGTLLWTCQHISDKSSELLKKWMEDNPYMLNLYFFEVDLVAIVS